MQPARRPVLLLALALLPALSSATGSGSECWWLTSPYGGWLEFEQAWYGRYLIASIVATAVCSLTCLVASLPACCGAWRGRPLVLRILSILPGVVAGSTMFIPLIMGLVKRSNYANEYCVHCSCPVQPWSAGARLTFRDVMADYSQGFGFLVLIFGVATLVLSFLSCCRCCGPLLERDTPNKQSGTVAPEV